VLLATRDRAGPTPSRGAEPRLPGSRLDERIGIAPAGPEIGRYDAILMAVPSQHLRAAAGVIASSLSPGTPVIACAKGIERGTRKFMTEVIADILPGAIPAILSGPSCAGRGVRFAHRRTLASLTRRRSGVANALGSTTFRPYHSTDARWVRRSSKNAPPSPPASSPARARRGRRCRADHAASPSCFRCGKAMGARAETLFGLSGLGDLIPTCRARSRDFPSGVGLAGLGQGRPLDPAAPAASLRKAYLRRRSGRMAE
jgi:glycerol-3-phosphate dehydrogenase (NAD(P)+)